MIATLPEEQYGIGPLELTTIDPLKAPLLCYRRELGIINVVGKGTVTVDAKARRHGFKGVPLDNRKDPEKILLNSAHTLNPPTYLL